MNGEQDDDPAKAGGEFAVELARILSHLTVPGAESTVARLQALRSASHKRHYAYALGARLTWWNVIERPFHVRRFLQQRRAVLSAPHVDLASLMELDALLARIEFGMPVPSYVRAKLRTAIARGHLTPRQAWRLTRSLGSRIEEAELLACPTSRAVVLIGSAATAVSVSTAAYCLFVALSLLLGHIACENATCALIGSLVLFVLASSVACVASVTTWGRNLASGVAAAVSKGTPPPMSSGKRYPIYALCSLSW